MESTNMIDAIKDATRIKVKLGENGMLPFKKNVTDAGFDLYATEDVTVYPGQICKHPLNIQMELPPGCYAQITSKSGLGSKGFLVYAGIIDELYRGVPHVVCTNLNWKTVPFIDEDGEPNVQLFPTEPIVIKKGEKIAQMILHPYHPHYFIEEVSKINTNTDRGEGGFGSTGK